MSNTKTLLIDICRYAYNFGAGNCWCEDIYKETIPYKMYTVITFFMYTTMFFLEILVAVLGTYPEAENSSAVMFVAVHTIVLSKMYLLLYHKISVRKVNHEMATVGEKFEERFGIKNRYRKAKVGIMFYITSVYLSLIAYGVDSLRKVIVEGYPFITLVTYYPRYEDTSFMATFFRVFFFVLWLYMMLPMLAADCIPITHLFAMTYKLIILRRYFESLRDDFDKDFLIDEKKANKKLKSGFLEGIRMHQRLLLLAEEMNRAFGMIMSLQLCESSAVAVLLLLRLALAPNLDLTNAFMTYTFVTSLFTLLGLNLWNAGEITYQASRLCSAMYNCGWQMCEWEKNKPHRDIRSMVLIGCALAQKPLILKAFGVFDLSYETFVSVVRLTYSVFAVFYQRRNIE